MVVVEAVVVWGATVGSSRAGKLAELKLELEEGGRGTGAVPVAVWVGGCRRYGMKESTRCSVTAGVRPAHHWLKPSL